MHKENIRWEVLSHCHEGLEAVFQEEVCHRHGHKDKEVYDFARFTYIYSCISIYMHNYSKHCSVAWSRECNLKNKPFLLTTITAMQQSIQIWQILQTVNFKGA